MRYLVFGFDWYYPSGGMDDLVGSFETFEEAKEYIESDKGMRLTYQDNNSWKDELRYNCNDYQIYDTVTGELTEIEGDRQ